MQSLQEYLIENIDEGKIWDSIKGWFKSLFDSEDKEFSRYTKNSLKGAKLNKYREYLEENFSKEKVIIKKLTDSELKEIVYPCGIMPDKEFNFGFYNFVDYKQNKYYKDSDYIGYMYNTKNVSDTLVLIQIKFNTDNTVELINLQINDDFSKVITFKDVINMLIKDKVIENYKIIVVKEQVNKDLYNQTINDCNFNKEQKNGENISILTINNEKNK